MRMKSKVVLKKKKKSIKDIEPEHFGSNSRKLSDEIDEILYGK